MNHIYWLAHTFSPQGIAAITARTLSAPDVALLLALAEEGPLPRLRAYVSATPLNVQDIAYMMRAGISYRTYRAWYDRLPPTLLQPSLPGVLQQASLFYDVPISQMNEWLMYVDTYGVVFEENLASTAWTFLGGDTALFVRAGIGPAEAEEFTRRGAIDRNGLELLSQLRVSNR